VKLEFALLSSLVDDFAIVRPVALELGLDVPVISHNGALTKHAKTLETVLRTSFATRLSAANNADW
jgi:hypothetical protein